MYIDPVRNINRTRKQAHMNSLIETLANSSHINARKRSVCASAHLVAIH
jgi:hypothetical protein